MEHRAAGTRSRPPGAGTDYIEPGLGLEVVEAAGRQEEEAGSAAAAGEPPDAAVVAVAAANLRRSHNSHTAGLDQRGERQQQLVELFVTRSTVHHTRQQHPPELAERQPLQPNTPNSRVARVEEEEVQVGEGVAEGCTLLSRKGSCSWPVSRSIGKSGDERELLT